jgi:hypothetical protein
MVFVAGLGAAEQAEVKETELPRAQVEAVLRERNRANAHPGQPLTIVGLDQGDNDLRSKTPALVHSDRAAALVDPEDAYQRMLAIYEGGVMLRHAPVTTGSVLTPGDSRQRSRAAGIPAVDAARATRPWLIAVGSCALAALGLLIRLGLPAATGGAGPRFR